MAHLLQPYVNVGISAHIRNLKIRVSALRHWWLELARSRPQYVRSLLIGLAIVTAVPIVGLVSYFIDLQQGLPDEEAIARIGEMDQATAVYDDRDQLAFTIFKEQRIDVPLSEVSPHLIHAILAIEDQRFYDHRGFDADPHRSAARSPTSATAAPRRAAARSRSSSRGRAS